jgi:hypothetical protein
MAANRTNGAAVQSSKPTPHAVLVNKAVLFDAEETRRALRVLAFVDPGDVVEMRAPHSQKGTLSGYFDDAEKMLKAAAEISGRCGATVYFTLNSMNRDLLARSVNHVTKYAKNTTTDANILRLRFLPLDLDPVRPAGISSTDAEHDAAIALAKKINAELVAQGWPQGTVIDSGNGAQILYRVDLPNDEASASLTERTLKGFAARYNNAAVTVDIAVFNAARIWKLPGTLAIKGDSVADRPHRIARVLSYGPPQIVTPAQLEKVAIPKEKPAAKPTGQKTGQRSFDLEELLRSYGDHYVKSAWKGGTKFVFDVCPNNPEHKNGFCVTQQASGGISAKCLHDSCRRFDWAAYRNLREPGHGMKAAPKPTVPVAVENMDAEPVSGVIERPDMPEQVLDGRLGEIYQKRLQKDYCVAYAWPSLVTIAGVSPALKFPGNPCRSNLFACLIGPVGAGKSTTADRCLHLLGLGQSSPQVLTAKFGSGEALMQELGTGEPVRLLYPDELKHLLEKMAIDRASFATLLTSAYYCDTQKGGTKRDKFDVDCRLSILGGLVEEEFGQHFGSATVSGFYDRFIFSLNPIPHTQSWRPYTEGSPERISPFPPTLADDVWDTRDQWLKDGISPRVAEHCVRMAYICAAVDGRPELRSSQLAPALAMAHYQQKVRSVMRPNPGENPVAQCAILVRTWLARNTKPGQFVSRRDLSRAIHSSDRLGPAVFNQTLGALSLNDEIHVEGKMVRLVE